MSRPHDSQTHALCKKIGEVYNYTSSPHRKSIMFICLTPSFEKS